MSWVALANKIKKIALQKQPIFLLNGEVIWEASDSLYLKSSMLYLLCYLLASQCSEHKVISKKSNKLEVEYILPPKP